MSCDGRLISVDLHADSLSMCICSACVNICTLLSLQDIAFRNKLHVPACSHIIWILHHVHVSTCITIYGARGIYRAFALPLNMWKKDAKVLQQACSILSHILHVYSPHPHESYWMCMWMANMGKRVKVKVIEAFREFKLPDVMSRLYLTTHIALPIDNAFIAIPCIFGACILELFVYVPSNSEGRVALPLLHMASYFN